MKRENLIREIIVNMSKLPNQNLMELSNFINFLMIKNENLQLVEGIKNYLLTLEPSNLLKMKKNYIP